MTLALQHKWFERSFESDRCSGVNRWINHQKIPARIAKSGNKPLQSVRPQILNQTF